MKIEQNFLKNTLKKLKKKEKLIKMLMDQSLKLYQEKFTPESYTITK